MFGLLAMYLRPINVILLSFLVVSSCLKDYSYVGYIVPFVIVRDIMTEIIVLHVNCIIYKASIQGAL